MRALKSTELHIWLLVNIFAPIIVPFCFALLINILIDTGKDWLDMVNMLWGGGAYIFLSLFVLVSLLPHFFDSAQSERKKSIVVIYTLTTVFVLFITCFLYLSHLSGELMKNVPHKSFTDNLQLSSVVTIIGVIIAMGFKVYFLHEKIRDYNHISDNIPILD